MRQQTVSKRELDKVISEVKKECGEAPEKTLVLLLIFKIYKFLNKEKNKDVNEEYEFSDILRMCANNIPFAQRYQRSLCKKAAGKYFGKHGGRKSARVRKKEIPKKAKKDEKTYREGEGGQLEFLI
jgi:hypothetical protein